MLPSSSAKDCGTTQPPSAKRCERAGSCRRSPNVGSMRSERQAKAASHVELIVEEVERLESEQKWAEALAAARRAESVVASSEADDETRRRVDELMTGLALVDQLEEARMTATTWIGSAFDYTGADRAYVAAFGRYGVNLDDLPVETSVERLRTRSSLAVPIAVAIDNWIQVRRRLSRDVERWRRLAAVARGIDPDPLRNRLRSFLGRPAAEVRDNVQQLAASIDVRTEQPATVVFLSDFLKRLNMADQASRLLQQAQRLHPHDFWVTFHLGYLALSRGDKELAARLFTAAVSLRPRSTAALVNLGNALNERKNLAEAEACFRRAVELDPTNVIALFNLGDLLRLQNKPEEAAGIFRTVIEFTPKNSRAYRVLGGALWHQNRPDEAIAAYHTALELDPDDLLVHRSLAGALGDEHKPPSEPLRRLRQEAADLLQVKVKKE